MQKGNYRASSLLLKKKTWRCVRVGFLYELTRQQTTPLHFYECLKIQHVRSPDGFIDEMGMAKKSYSFLLDMQSHEYFDYHSRIKSQNRFESITTNGKSTHCKSLLLLTLFFTKRSFLFDWSLVTTSKIALRGEFPQVKQQFILVPFYYTRMIIM